MLRLIIFILLLSSSAFAQYEVKQNELITEKRAIPFFAADVVDGITAVPGLSPACTKRLPTEGAFTACSGTVSEIAEGVYLYELSATEIDDEGLAVFLFKDNVMLVARVSVQLKKGQVTVTNVGN